ncbi:uncharacterized protein [Montipora foliosa]|uniref:uncharacterized protein isoform X2 n=1 Tax=Montipora foliosa TaxID=591990 RepID=UPI0035F218CD
MAQFPTYISRLDPQFRRFVSVVNVHSSSENSISKDDSSKDGAASLQSTSSFSDSNQEVLSVDAYTEEDWHRARRAQSQVSELFLEYVNILSSDSDTSLGNYRDTGFSSCTSSCPGREGNPHYIRNSEQREGHAGIRDDCFEDDSVFWSDDYDEDFHKQQRSDQCLQKRPAMVNKEVETLDWPLGGSLSSLDRGKTYCNETQGQLENVSDTKPRDTWKEDNAGAFSLRKDRDTVGAQNMSRQSTRSLDELSSVESESGYAPDFIEDGYSSTSSADSSLVCFALVGKNGDEGAKRKLASRGTHPEGKKKQRRGKVDSENLQSGNSKRDPGLKACVVAGISGGPAVRVFRDEDPKISKRPKSKSAPKYPPEDSRRYFAMVDDDFSDQGASRGLPFEQERAAVTDRESVFALFASPGNPSKRDEQAERKRDTEEAIVRGPAGVRPHEQVLLGHSGNWSQKKAHFKETAGPLKSEVTVADKSAGKRDDSSSRNGKVTFHHKPYSRGELDNLPKSNWMGVSKERVDSDLMSKQTPRGGHGMYEGSDAGKQPSVGAQMKRVPGNLSRSQVKYGNVKDKVDSFKLQSAERQAIGKPAFGRQRQGDNLEETKPQDVTYERAPRNDAPQPKRPGARKMSEERVSDWFPRERVWVRNNTSECALSEIRGDKKIKDQCPPLKPDDSALTNENVEYNTTIKNDEALLEKDSSNKSFTDTITEAEFVIPVRKTIRKTIQGFTLDDSYVEGETSSKKEDHVAVAIKGEKSLINKAEDGVMRGEDKEVPVKIPPESLQEKVGRKREKETELVEHGKAVKIDNMRRKRISDAGVSNFADEDRGLTSGEKSGIFTAVSSVDRGSHGSDVSDTSFSSQTPDEIEYPVVEKTREDLRDSEAELIKSRRQKAQLVTDQLVGGLSRRSRSPKTREPKFNLVNNRKVSEKERRATDRSVESNMLLETSSKNSELCPKLKCDLSPLSESTDRPSGDFERAGKPVARNSDDPSLRIKPVIEGNGEKSITKKESGTQPFLEDESLINKENVEDVNSKNYADVSSGEDISRAKYFVEEGVTFTPSSSCGQRSQSWQKDKTMETWRSAVQRNESKVSSFPVEDGPFCGEAVQSSDKQAETALALHGKETTTVVMPLDMTGKLEVKDFGQDDEKLTRTDSPPEDKSRDHRVSIGTSLLCANDLSERRGIAEDICFVDGNEIYPEAGALPTEATLELNPLGVQERPAQFVQDNEALSDYDTEIKFLEGMALNEIGCFAKDVGNNATASRNTEVEEVVCTFDGLDHGPLPMNNPTRDLLSETSSGKSHSKLVGEKRVLNVAVSGQHNLHIHEREDKAEAGDPVNASKVHFGKLLVCDGKSVCGTSNHASSQGHSENALKSETHEGVSCNEDIHCDCLQQYLLQGWNSEGKRNHHEMPEASSTRHDFDAGFEGKSAEKPASAAFVGKVLEKERQVAVIKELGDQPVYENKGNQTSSPYHFVNAECQTNVHLEVCSEGSRLQQHDVECQTELFSKALASVGVQVEVPGTSFEDESQHWEALLRDDMVGGGRGIDGDRENVPDCELPVTSSKGSQVDADIKKRDVIGSSHQHILDNGELQMSRNDFPEYVNGEISTADNDSRPVVSVVSKESQTSLENLYVATSTQCDLLTVQSSKNEATMKGDEKGCQTSLDDDLILAVSKECQTCAPSRATEKDKITGIETTTTISYQSKECQTLLDNSFLVKALKEFQTALLRCTPEEPDVAVLGIKVTGDKKEPLEAVSSIPALQTQCPLSGSDLFGECPGLKEENEKVYESKETQTIVDSDLLCATTKGCQTSQENLEVETNTSFEIKECQTLPTYDLLLASSKACQTLIKEIEISHQHKECQTFPDLGLVPTSSKRCQTPWLVTSEEVGKMTKTTQRDIECQTLLDAKDVLATSKQCQTVWVNNLKENEKLGEKEEISKTNKECQTETFFKIPVQSCPERPNGIQAIKNNSKECQTDTSCIHLAALSRRADAVSNSTQTEDSPPRNNSNYQSKDSQTAVIVLSSKSCQTSSSESSVNCRDRESQTVPEGDVDLLSSKECQTMPYSLEELQFLIRHVKGLEDVKLCNVAQAEESSDTSRSLPMGVFQDASHPSCDGEALGDDEAAFFDLTSHGRGGDTRLYQTAAKSERLRADSPFPVYFAEVGCQAVLCHCGSFFDERENHDTCSSVATDNQIGAAMRVSEGMQKEQASLIKQLDILRDMNQKLRDDKDAIEAAHEAKKERGNSLSDEIEEAEKKSKVSRQGSQMSRYLRRKRNAGPGETWGNQTSMGSLSEDDTDGRRASRHGKRRDMKKQGSVMSSYFGMASNNSLSGPVSGSHHKSIEEDEAEFEGDPTLELVSDEKAQELEAPAWAAKIMSYVQQKETSEEDDDNLSASNEELEEDVFRKRKHELISAAPGRGRLKEVREESDMSLSEELSDESGSASDARPSSPRAAPVGKDNIGSLDRNEVGISASGEPSTPERVFKVVFVGDSGVGKSSFIHRFCHDGWKPSFTATIGVDFQIRTMTTQGRYIALQLWDTAGQERFRSITKQYFRKADGVIVFYDVTMESSFLHIKNWMISVEEGTDEGTAIMIVGNKTDLLEDESGRPVKSEDGMKLAEDYKALYSETSAKTGFNIKECMEEFAKMLQDREDEYMQSVLNLVPAKPAQKKCCK